MESTTNESRVNGNGAAIPRANGNGAPIHVEKPASAPPVAVADAAPAKRGGRTPLLILAALVVIGGGVYGYHRVTTANQEDTDDAQVESDVVPLAARAGGLVLHLNVHENQTVHAGDIILELDPQEYQARVDQAVAELETQRATATAADSDVQLVTANAHGGLRAAQATVSSAVDSVRSAQAGIAAAQAGIARARAQAQQTSTNLARVRALRADRAIAQAELDNAQASDEAAQAAVAQAEAQLATAMAGRASATAQIGQAQGRLEQSAPVDVLLAQARARADLAHARVRSAEAALSLARLTLSYTHVTAPNDGEVSRLGVHEGQLIVPGQAIAELVPTGTYLIANYKETQIGRMRTGNRAEIRVDAFPGRTFHGTVESLSGGTGARFSLLPPDNASGNFVKVVQRVPVRIRWTDAPRDVPLRAGLSSDVTVFF